MERTDTLLSLGTVSNISNDHLSDRHTPKINSLRSQGLKILSLNQYGHSSFLPCLSFLFLPAFMSHIQIQ